MEEDAGIKAPVTRLRRRISTEQSEESKSPALNTPTKKRGGRRTAKPDLEPIDEHTPNNATTKKTAKKVPIKDLIDIVEDKPVTPSRRSTRIKSKNSSIVSETTIAVDSPRAKRAARRLSQVVEAPPTKPALAVEKDPSANIHTTVLIEDDSGTISGKVNIQNSYEHEDQCVPEVEHTKQLEKDSSQISVSSEKVSNIVEKTKSGAILNDSCEPMDIDETIPEILLVSEVNSSSPVVSLSRTKSSLSQNVNNSGNENKSTLLLPENLLVSEIISSSPVVLLHRIASKGSNASGTKSSLSQNVNKSGNENKSTLILSQLKDSSTDINNMTKSPQSKDIYLKATDDLNTTQENEANKRNLSINYVTTSTPLQQKKVAKLVNINTSIIACNKGVKDVETNELNQSKNESKISSKVENENAKNKLVLNNSVSDNNKSNNEIDKSASKKDHNSCKYSAEDTDSEEELHNHENENQKGKNNSSSIVSETTIAVDSPRAKRAARRLSQVGSDSQAPLTPVRQTRRTRKDSTSSIEKVEAPPTKPALHINDVIIEEPENTTTKYSSGTNDTNTSPTNIRKSPHLQGKAKKNNPDNEKKNVEQTEPHKQTEKIHNSTQELKNELSTEGKYSQKSRLSATTSDLIKNLKTPVTAKNTNLNKSTSALDIQLEGKQKIKRTKSWPTLTVSNENNFFSDNEDVKKKLREKTKGRIFLESTNKLNLGDGLNTSLGQNITDKSILKKKKNSNNSFVVEDINTSLTDSNNQTINEKNYEKSLVSLNNSQKNYASEIIKLVEKDPSANIHTTVLIEDDSGTNSGKVNIQNSYEHEDQCVPEVEHTNQLEKDSSQISVSSEKVSNIVEKTKSGAILNDSCEPMDIDKTIPENLLVSEVNSSSPVVSLSRTKSSLSQNVNNSGNENKSTLLLPENLLVSEIISSSPVVLLHRIASKGSNASGTKSSLSQNANKSGNENKSTLILSQLKDSSTDINNMTKSPQSKDIYLKATDDLNTTQENEANKRNLSINYVTTSTPLQQKKVAKLVNINTSIIVCNKGVKDVETNELNQSQNESKISSKVENENAKNKLVLNNSVSDNNKSNNEIDKSASKKDHNSCKYSAEDTDSEEELHNHENENQKGKNNSCTKTLNQSNTLNDTDPNNESASEEESHNTSKLLDDKAEDAGDDYESGDSLDENDRQYLKENEILEKGETLSSENELSNDSDYEKDSFVVSSDEEDNELLEGTEDDLSMSDNELKMTAKSKKKFNERKKKEQKSASREMFESRHKLNKSNSSKTGKSKKPIQQQSISESEDETEIKTKKNNRMRLDSSQEVSLLEDKNEQKVRKKKSKRLSESICDDYAMNENEITVCNKGLKETDPLSTSVKDEPKTPQKAHTSIAFINTDKDANDQNDLTKTQTEIEDPLEDSMAEDESLSSDNENIIQNYDSVLEGLNKTNKAKSKECDISFNIDKKQNKKINMAIVDELNLTQVKSTKKLMNKNKQKKSLAENKTSKLDLDDGASSDSTDFKLLFSEDSNSSDNIQNKPNISSSNKEHFVPLKNTEGKTNIRKNIDTTDSNSNEIAAEKDKGLNIEKTVADENSDSGAPIEVPFKKEKRLSNAPNNTTEDRENETVADENSDSGAPIEVPFKKEKRLSNAPNNTTEDRENETVADENSDSGAPIEVPFKKEKRLSNAPNNTTEDRENETVADENSDSGAPIEVPFKKEKRLSNAPNNTTEDRENETVADENSDSGAPIEVPFKKEKRLSNAPNNTTEDRENETVADENSDSGAPIEVPFKKEKRLSNAPNNTTEDRENETGTTIQADDKPLLKTPGSNKKKKRRSQSEREQKDTTIQANDKSLLKTPGSNKKNKRVSQSEQDQEDENNAPPDMFFNETKTSAKKKKRITKTSEDSNQNDSTLQASNKSLLKTPDSSKQKKRLSQSEQGQEETENISELDSSKLKSPGSHKKLKATETQEQKPIENKEHCVSIGSAKKSKKSSSSSSIIEAPLLSTSVHSENNDTSAKKRKRKSSLNAQEETVEDVLDTLKKSNNSLVGNQKKKRKIAQNEEIISIAEPTVEEHRLEHRNVSKEKTLKKEHQNVVNNTELPTLSKSRKRKQRDEDEGQSVSKVVKQSSFDKVHVPRLPASILKQLDDKPQESFIPKKPKVISTTEFAVVEAKKRKNKPSNYLEESVYLNDDEAVDKKRKKRLQKPKVLPFLPTASTSLSGYTSNFKVNVIPSEIKFVAQSNMVSNFKEDYLFNKKIKRQGTYELYKRNRNIKLSKF